MQNLKANAERLLKDFNIEHEFIRLPDDIPVDLESHIKFHGIERKQATPTLIFQTDKGLIAVQKRADTEIDFNKLRKLAGVAKIAFATKEVLQEMGADVGIVPLVGLAIPTYVDRKILEVEQIYGGGGIKEYAIKMLSKDLARSNKATVGDFSEEMRVGPKRVLAGMRPTGRLHIGNYLGGAKGMLALQSDEQYETYYTVVDIHAITTPYDPATLRESAKGVYLDYLAIGLDPKKSVITLQSDLADLITQLAFYFSSVVSMARMQHLPTFKDKIKQHPDNVTMALLNYPVLMAADILIYKAGMVPVGIDQEPHIEIAREIARKMNEVYGMDFPEPQRFATAGEYVPSLMGEGKMSKSVEGSFITLTDSLDTIRQRLATAPTDSGKGSAVPTTGGVANLLQFTELFMGKDKRKEYEAMYTSTGLRYKDIKEELAQAIFAELEPIQQRRKELEQDPGYVDDVIKSGAKKARLIAEKTVMEVREKMGLA